MRLIDADELLEKIECLFKDLNSFENYMYNHGVGDSIATIKSAPTIEAEPVKRGKWIRERRPCIFSQTGSADWLTCSVCGERFSTTEVNKEKYCRSCGAKMKPISASSENG